MTEPLTASRRTQGLPRLSLMVAACAAVVAIGLTFVPSSPAAEAEATDPPLSIAVSNNHLVNGDGQPIQLAGVSQAGTDYMCVQGRGVFDGPTDATAIEALVAWHVQIVRIPLNEDCWLGINGVATADSGLAYQEAIAAYVERLNDAGILTDLELHYSAPGNQLATGQQDMADADHSPALWSSVASVFKNDPATMFELYNEPHDITWQCWRDGCTAPGGWAIAGMQQLVDAVRAAGAQNPIIVGGLNWSDDLSNWYLYRPTDPDSQLIAGFHVYNFTDCNSPQCWDATVLPLVSSVPVIATEIGENDCSGSFITSFMDWADRFNISYLAWSWNDAGCGAGPSLLSTGMSPTPYGAVYRQHLLARFTAPS
jgi:hypothetical protein